MKMFRSEPLTEREKRHLRQVNGTKKPFSTDNPVPSMKKVREYNDTIVVTLGRRTRLGFNGCKLSPAKRAMVELRTAKRESDRRAFFASLGVRV